MENYFMCIYYYCNLFNLGDKFNPAPKDVLKHISGKGD